MSKTENITKVQFFKRSYSPSQLSGMDKILNSGFLTSGSIGLTVENKINNYFNSPYSCLTNSWTNGFFVALKALDLEKNSEIIIPAMTFVSVANVPVLAGMKLKIVDVDKDDSNLRWSYIEKSIRPKTKVILLVHMYGLMIDVKEIKKKLKEIGREDIYIIEDCAHAFESSFESSKPGSFSDAAIFSFYATKNVSCGEGGAIISKHKDFIEKCHKLRLHGMSKDAHDRYSSKLYSHYDVAEHGFKANLPDLLSVLLLEEIDNVDKKHKERKKIYKTYRKMLSDEDAISLPPDYDPKKIKHAHHLFPIYVDAGIRDKVIYELNNSGIGVAVNFRSITQLSAFQNFKSKNAEELGSRQISLPFYPGLRIREIEYVTANLKRIVKSA